MISILGKNKRFAEAMKVMQKMRMSGCVPDNFTYASIFDGIGRAVDIPKVDQYPMLISIVFWPLITIDMKWQSSFIR